MSVGVMKDYKLRDLHVSHTLFIMKIVVHYVEDHTISETSNFHP